METMNEIRPYTKSELATMYFPIGSASNALRRLNRYIHHATDCCPRCSLRAIASMTATSRDGRCN